MAIRLESLDSEKYNQLYLDLLKRGQTITIDLPLILKGDSLEWKWGVHLGKLGDPPLHIITSPGQIVDLASEQERFRNGYAGYIKLGRDRTRLMPRDSHTFKGVLKITQGLLGLCRNDEDRFNF